MSIITFTKAISYHFFGISTGCLFEELNHIKGSKLTRTSIGIVYSMTKMRKVKTLKEYMGVRKSIIAIAVFFILILFLIAEPIDRGAMAGTIVELAIKGLAYSVVGYSIYLGYKSLRGKK